MSYSQPLSQTTSESRLAAANPYYFSLVHFTIQAMEHAELKISEVTVAKAAMFTVVFKVFAVMGLESFEKAEKLFSSWITVFFLTIQ